jgi:tetratricopeptide (TPR) repeat protein/SAM-dependent methyltransferase
MAPKHATAARVEASAARALELHRRGRLAEAVAAYREAVALAPEVAELHFNLGTALHALGRVDDAIEAYRAALAREPTLAVAHDNLGNALAARGEYDAAIASYTRALAAAPGHLPARYNLAVALQRSGRSAQAVPHYREIVARAPAVAPAHYNLALALMDVGEVDEAIGAFERAAALHPADAEIRGNLAEAHLARGAVDDAIACLKQAIAQSPRNAPLHNNLGNALDLAGDTTGALASYREALALQDGAEVRANVGRALATAPKVDVDPGLRALLVRALEEGWARPADLARVCASAVDPHAPTAALACDGLTIALLTRAPIRDAALERRFTALRRAWLAEALAQAADSEVDDLLPLRCALARQCFINEYVYACDDESADVAALRARISGALQAGEKPPFAWLAAGASYFPLGEVEGAEALLPYEWSAPVAALMQQQVHEPRVERDSRETIPPLTAIRDGTSQRVRAQYEDNPYPRWVCTPGVPSQGSFNAWLRRRFPRADIMPLADDAALEVLVAGCGTGQEPIELAQSFPSARVLGVDLSVASLAHAKRHTIAMGLRNLEYAHADVLELPAQPRRFDVVSAVGVLHHLADPGAGLRALCGVLRPGGLLRLGFYSERARRDVAAARNFIASQDYASDAASIRRSRQALLTDPAFEAITARADFWTTSACRDLLFHVEEHDTDLTALAALLAQNGLCVVGVLLEPRVIRRYVERFPDDPAAVDLGNWHAFEEAHPTTFAGMYRLWVQRR